MVDTLRELAQRYPGNGLVLLLGADQLRGALDLARAASAAAARAHRGRSPARGLARRAGRRGRRAHRHAAGRHLLVDDPRARRRGPPDPPPGAGSGARADRGRGPLPLRPRGKVARVRYHRSLEPGCLSRGHELAERIAAIAADKLAQDIVVLDMGEVVGYTDAFVICSGRTPPDAGHRRGDRARLKHEDGLLPEGRRGPSRGRLDPARLPRRASCTSSRPRRARSTASSSSGARCPSASSSDRNAGGRW